MKCQREIPSVDEPLYYLAIFFMQISEKELEDFIYEDLKNNNGTSLQERGLRTRPNELLEFDLEENISIKWLRQVSLGAYGILDIVGYYRSHTQVYVELFELKNVPIVSGHFDQILRYKNGIQEYFGDRFKLNFHCYLVGSDFESGHYIHNSQDHFSVSEFSYGLNGIQFKTHSGGWVRTNDNNFDSLKTLKNAEAVYGY